MKKSSGVRLQELPCFSPLQYTDRPLLNFSQPLFLYFFLPFLFLFFFILAAPSFPALHFKSWCFSFLRLFPSSLTSLSLCLLSAPLSPPHLFLSLSSGIACLIFYLCGGAAGWIRAWTGPTNHPDLQDSFSITSPMLFHLYKYKHRERATEHERGKNENNREE